MIPYQEAPDPPVDASLRARCADQLHVLSPDGHAVVGDQAVLYIYEQLGYGRWIAVLRWPPLSWLTAPGYALLANHRRFFSRFVFRSPE